MSSPPSNDSQRSPTQPNASGPQLSRPAQRYDRQSQFNPIGEQGQRRIEGSKVAILGCGALGSVAAELLARAGVGHLRLIDRDLVEWSNLQRQSLYDESDATNASAKAEAAANHLRKINSSIQIEERVVDIVPSNINEHLLESDLVVDATDNFSVRLLLNDWSLKTNTPWVHGGCVGAGGQVRFFGGHAPCFRCLLPNLPGPGETETCDTAGVIGPATHLIASLQSSEALKWLSGNRDAVNAKVLSIDLWNNSVRQLAIPEQASQDCPACARRQFEFLAAGEETFGLTQTLCGRDAVQISGNAHESGTMNLDRIAEYWKSSGTVQRTRFFVRLLISDQQTLTLFRDGRAVISGVRDIPHARSLYDRYIGS